MNAQRANQLVFVCSGAAGVGELPRDWEIVCFCKVSQRGYEAQRVVDGEGFTNVKLLDGGQVAWPYPLQTGNDNKERK